MLGLSDQLLLLLLPIIIIIIIIIIKFNVNSKSNIF